MNHRHSPDSRHELRHDDRQVRRWQDAVELARQDVAARLSRSLDHERFHRNRYQDWLAMESVVCRIGALSLDAVANWHVTTPTLRATAEAWATELRDHARLAASDVRELDGIAGPSPGALGQWQAFVSSAGSSHRAGEVLGAALVAARLPGGPVREAAAAIAGLPFVRRGGYLHKRLLAPEAAWPEDRDALLEAYAASALAVGAHRAANWYRAGLAELLER